MCVQGRDYRDFFEIRIQEMWQTAVETAYTGVKQGHIIVRAYAETNIGKGSPKLCVRLRQSGLPHILAQDHDTSELQPN